MKIRFQADADFNEDAVSGVIRRRPEIDFKTATEAGLRGMNDMEVLSSAALEGRILVSHDRKTMPLHFAEFIRTRESPGLLLVSQKTEVLAVVEELVMIWDASEAEEWVNRVCSVPL